MCIALELHLMDVMVFEEFKVGSCGLCTRMLLLPARNLAPGNVALVLSPPRTRSLPGAFFLDRLCFRGWVLKYQSHSV